MLSVIEVVRRTTEHFASRGLPSPRLNAELLVGHVLGLSRMQLYVQFERPVTEAELERLRPLVRRRAKREPVQYVIGVVEFAGLRLKVDRRVLIPRPETEYLVELLLREMAGRSPPDRILDLGTGSGALALALAAHFEGSAVLAVDRSEDAIQLARENAAATGLQQRLGFLRSDWYESLPREGRYDLIVSNPPYLSASDLAQAPVEVREHEPLDALCPPDPEGLSALETILSGAASRLTESGLIAVETGQDQHERLIEVAKACGLGRTESFRDLTGRNRYLLARRN